MSNNPSTVLAAEFPKVFTLSDIEQIENEREIKLLKSEHALSFLRSHHVSLKNIYSALYKCNLEAAYSLIESDC